LHFCCQFDSENIQIDQDYKLILLRRMQSNRKNGNAKLQPETAFSSREELESYWQLWQGAGVHEGYTESPKGWLETSEIGRAVNSVDLEQTSEKSADMDRQTGKTDSPPMGSNDQGKILSDKAHIQKATDSIPNIIGQIESWWAESPSIEMVSGFGARVSPLLIPSPQTLIIADMPDQDDEDILFSGRSGKLLRNILSATGLDIDQTAFLPVWPRYSHTPEMEMDRQSFWQDVTLRMIGLCEPRSIILCGKWANMVVTGKDLAENRRSLPIINHDERSIPAGASFHPRTLLARPAMKRAAWKDWLRYREFLNEEGIDRS